MQLQFVNVKSFLKGMYPNESQKISCTISDNHYALGNTRFLYPRLGAWDSVFINAFRYRRNH